MQIADVTITGNETKDVNFTFKGRLTDAPAVESKLIEPSQRVCT